MDQTDHPKPVILDTDIGDDIDDTWALGMLMGCRSLAPRLIVTTDGDTAARGRLVAKMLQCTGSTEVPIGIGRITNDARPAQADWLEGWDPANYEGKMHEDGARAMIEAIEASREPLTIITIGPLTNLAEALRRRPEITRNARVVAMAGSLRTASGGEAEPAEHNVATDPQALREVLAAAWPVVLAPLDVCGDVTLEGDAFDRIRTSPRPWPRVIMENLDAWRSPRVHSIPLNRSTVLFDTVAVAAAVDLTWFEVERQPINVTEQGRTVIDGQHGKFCHCLTGWTNRSGFEQFLLQTLTETI